MTSEESATPDVVERVGRYIEAVSRRDFDAVEAFYAPDAVLHGDQIGTFEGRAAARGVMEDICAPYEEFHAQTEEVVDLGSGVVFVVVDARGRLGGIAADVQVRFASVAIWREGVVERQINYIDIDEARVAGERLAEERGQPVPRSRRPPTWWSGRAACGLLRAVATTT